MINIRNVNGFTLMELLIVLVILSIIVSIGLLVINITRTNFDNLNTSNSKLIDIQDADMKLNSFFFNSDTLFFDDNHTLLNSKGEKFFKIENDKIIDFSKDQIILDSITEIKLNFYKNQSNKKIVTCFYFNKKLNIQPLPFTYCKHYDIATRLKYPYNDSLTTK